MYSAYGAGGTGTVLWTLDHSGYVEDVDDVRISFIVNTDNDPDWTLVKHFASYGVLAYRLVYDNGVDEQVVAPAEFDDGDITDRKAFFASSINNRAMSRNWQSINVRFEDTSVAGESYWSPWYEYFKQVALDFANDENQPHPEWETVSYNGLFVDVVDEKLTGAHSCIDPYDYGGADVYEDASVAFFTAVNEALPSSFKLTLNGLGLTLFERLQGLDCIDTIVHEDFVSSHWQLARLHPSGFVGGACESDLAFMVTRTRR